MSGVQTAFQVERTAGRDPDQEERQGDDDEQRQDRRQKPTDDIEDHCLPPPGSATAMLNLLSPKQSIARLPPLSQQVESAIAAVVQKIF
jgi:hypothetical protein